MNEEFRILGNPIRKKDLNAAESSKKKYIKRFGDDSNVDYPVTVRENPTLGRTLGITEIRVGDTGGEPAAIDTEKGLIVGNIRMGFGHYRISIAIASAAHEKGLIPYWMDLNSYPVTTCTKVIGHQNDLYSKASRISQKSKLFNKWFWEPLNYEGFRQLSYNVKDQKNAELMAPVFKSIPKDIPVVGTHVWPAQAALHAGMKYVVNAIPDNWPMALHLSEGALHTVQTHYAYQGYRILNGMQKNDVLLPMPKDSLLYTGHYIDHELVSNIDADCEMRVRRAKGVGPLRFLLTVGGAGAQREIFSAVVSHLLPLVKKGKAALYVNVGDYRNVWDGMVQDIEGLRDLSTEHFNDWAQTCAFCESALSGEVKGIHAFFHENIFEAVYTTNLLMRSCDVLVTKPSELSFYPVPKLFIRRIGGHEQWGAVHSAEIGDGTLECRDIPHTLQMTDLFLDDPSFLEDMCDHIRRNRDFGIYDGAYRVIDAALNMKNGR